MRRNDISPNISRKWIWFPRDLALSGRKEELSAERVCAKGSKGSEWVLLKPYCGPESTE